MSLRVSRKTVVEEWGLPLETSYEGEGNKVEVIEDRIVDTSRWSIIHELVVRINDKVYITEFSEGATEYQDERPWQDEKMVEFLPAKEIVIRKWVVDNGIEN